MEALHYIKLENQWVKCELCPHECKLKPGGTGLCNTRVNDNGTLRVKNYGVIASSGLDPIEKKPLYHYHPGKKIFSIGGYGCNLHCLFCQNHEISQYVPDDIGSFRTFEPQDIVTKASILPENIGIAYTYTEPTVFFELMLATAQRAREQNLKNVMVSNGFIYSKPLLELLTVIDAFNVDLKSFTDSFYKKITGGRLIHVLENLKAIKKNGKHLEITFLVIPDLNDSASEASAMFKWIAQELGNDTPIHINRYYPAYRLSNPPTPPKKLFELYELATEQLKFVYIGNLHGAESRVTNTHCPSCNSILIERQGYNISFKMLNSAGYCKVCGYGPVIVMD